MSNTLYSLEKYLDPILGKSNASDPEDDEELFADLEPLFDNRIYCKEELEYNLGVCYLMLKKYKQAYFYLQHYPPFLVIIKQAIAITDCITSENEFLI